MPDPVGVGVTTLRAEAEEDDDGVAEALLIKLRGVAYHTYIYSTYIHKTNLI